MTELPDRATYRARWRALHGGYDPAAATVADRWLRAMEQAARPLALRGVSPDAITAAGVAASALAAYAASAGSRSNAFAAAAVLAAGVADGLDGSVAALSGRATAWGFVLDSLADRVSDGLQLLALQGAGAFRPVVAAAGCGTVALEYGRARAGAAGFGEVGVVTAGERPMRVAAAAAGLLAAGLRPSRSAAVASGAAGVIAALTTVGSAQFLRHARIALKGVQARPMSPATARAESATSGNPPPG